MGEVSAFQRTRGVSYAPGEMLCLECFQQVESLPQMSPATCQICPASLCASALRGAVRQGKRWPCKLEVR